MPELDAPDLLLVREHIPEVAERLAGVHAALEAARVAQEQVQAAEEPDNNRFGTGRGSATAAALAADVAAVGAGKRPTGYAQLVAARPQLEGELRACRAYANQLVKDWNADAHQGVKPATRKALAEQRDQAAAGCVESAEKALAAADSVGVDDGRRLRAALGDLADLDGHVKRWRDLEALLGWATWRRPVPNGKAWDPFLYHENYPNLAGAEEIDAVTHARALADDALRRQVRERLEQRPGLTRAR